MSQLAFIALGGALGAVSRFLVSNGVYALLGRGFPWGTLAVNMLGSLAMGVLAILLLERITVSSELRGLLLVGFLGAFTTFSTFSIETLNLIEEGALMRAGLNAVLSVVLCLAAAWLGVFIGRQL
ncbi:MAG: fluoride efflux transporter CrcB [Gammaproteobacteria bacterium]|nr:MAG: fluoride efflux transporter CrcB [Gammaproteobacteria bacterium]